MGLLLLKLLVSACWKENPKMTLLQALHMEKLAHVHPTPIPWHPVLTSALKSLLLSAE